ncbi:TlpA family protein disulfide reductase [Spongiimicrobium sp. 3-5]|uniref:TlpA family protein disulfide reductase n=1 Tax=Spongiimicrobium sp. 3-5 TaxID=3332596 RepID=UPI00397F39E4
MTKYRMITGVMVFLFTLSLQAQQTIKGTFSPAGDYTWLIAYRLTPGSQTYVADTAIKKGEFTMQLPENALPGTYRLVYAVPQDEFYFDILYNGKEDTTFTFSEQAGLTFLASEENTTLKDYFWEVQDAERKVVNFYRARKNKEEEFLLLVNNLGDIQSSYEEKSLGLLCHHFIKANKTYLPKNLGAIETYVKQRKEHYFDNLDFQDPVLLASGFLNEKVANYVFTALPLGQLSKTAQEREMQNNIDEVANQLQGVDEKYILDLYYKLWQQSTANGYNSTADLLYHSHLKDLASKMDNTALIDQITLHNRTRRGSRAPEVVWENTGKTKKLSELKGAEYYVLVFWSSTCSHCLNELPKLQQGLADNNRSKVLAIALEDDEVTWKLEKERLSGFEHALALGKWDSEYAKLYGIQQTPTYFILDKDKEILGKPSSYDEVLSFLEGH